MEILDNYEEIGDGRLLYLIDRYRTLLEEALHFGDEEQQIVSLHYLDELEPEARRRGL